MGKYVNPHEGARRIEQKKKKYINSHSGAERNRGGVVEGTAYLAGNLGLGVAGVAEGLTDIAAAGGHLMRGDLYMAKQPFIDSKTAEAQQDLEEWYNPGGGMKLAGDVVSGAGQSVSYGLLSAIPIIGKPLMFASIGAQGVSSAAGRTGDVGLKELGYGATVGAVEGILESKLGAGVNAVKSLGSAALKRTGVNVAKSAAKVGGKSMIASVLVDTAKGAAGEFAEEAISEAVDPALLRLFNIDENAQFNLGNVLYAGVVGALSGGLMTAGPAAINFESARKTGQSIREAGEVEQTLHTAEMLIKGAERAQTTAKESKATEKPGKDASVGQKITATAKSAVSGIKSGQEASKARQMADKLQKNVAAYRQIMADPAKATSSVADALLGELRGNMYLAQVAYQIETYEAILANAEPEQKQQIVDVINAEAAKLGAKRSDYTVADLEANTDDIVTKLAAEMSLSSLARVFDTAEATEKPAEAPTSPWDGMSDSEDMSGYKAAGEAEQALLKAAVKESVPRGSVQAMLDEFRKGTNMTPEEFATAWSDGVHIYGRYGFDVGEESPLSRMSPEAREAAMKFGRETEEDERKSAEEKAKAKKKPAEMAGKKGAVVRGKGLEIKTLSDEQYAAYKAAEVLAEVLGTEIVIETAITDKKGRTVNGYYDAKTNRLHVNINALRDGKNISLYTLGHEVTHYIKEWSPTKFEALADFVLDQMGVDAEAAVAEKLASLKRLGIVTDTMTVAEANALAREELVAEGMELVLTDGKVLEELSKADKSLWEKIRDWFFDIIGQIRQSWQDLNQASKTAQVLKETVESLEEIERLFTEGVREAGERTRTAGVETVTRMNESDAQVTYSSEESVDTELLDFYHSVMAMEDKRTVGKRKKNLGKISGNHANIIAETIKKETGETTDVSGYELWIDGSAIVHIEDKHGKNGSSDHSMEDPKDVARIEWAANNAEYGRMARTKEGEIDYSTHFRNSDGSPSPKVILEKPIGNGRFIVAECVPDSNSKKIHIVSARIEKGDKGQVLNVKSLDSSQPTSETPLDGHVTKDIVSQDDGSVNTSSENSPGNIYETEDGVMIDPASGTYLPQEPVIPEFDTDLLHELTEKYVAGEKAKTEAESPAFKRALERVEAEVVGDDEGRMYSIDETPENPDVSENRDLTDREILGMALEGAVQSQEEYNIIKSYREQAALLELAREKRDGYIKETNALERQIKALRARMEDEGDPDGWIRKAMDDAIAKKREAERMRDEQVKILDNADRELLRMKAAKPFREILAREQKRVRAAEYKAERAEEKAEKARETTKRVREEYKEKIYKARRDATDYKRAVYRTAYEKAEEKNRAYRERTDRKADESRERKEMTARKRTIMRVLGGLQTKLVHPTKTNHAPKELHDLVQTVMRTADPKAWDANRKNIREMGDLAAAIEKLERQATRTAKEQERLDAMKSKYEILEQQTMPLAKQAQAMYAAYKQYNDNLPEDMRIPESVMTEMSEMVDKIEDVPLKEMGLESLKAVETFVKALSTQINNANELFVRKRGEQVSDWGNAASREAAESKPLKWLSPKSMEIKNARDARDFLWKNMKPLTAFEAIGSPKLMELFQSVLDGEEVWITDVLEAREAIVKAKEAYGYDTWDLKTRREFTNAEGKAVRLTVGEMMSLCAYAKREQAMGHLRGGGFVLDAGATEITEKNKIRTEKMLNLTERYTMTEEDMGKLAGMLTEEQKQYATEIQDYLTSLGEKGNEISRKLYGLDLFNEKYYFPIKVKSEYLESQTGKTGDPKIKNRGMSKETVPDAQNPLVLQDFMTIVSGHVNDMATYHAFVLPVEDLTRVLNYQPSNAIIDEDGNWTEDKERKDYSTLKAVIESKYGAQANAYIEQLIRDLNGGARREAAANLIDKGITAFKRASTMASLSVLVQQPTSVFRAMAYVDPKHFRSLAALDIKGHKEAWEQVKTYAKVAAIKEMGGYDTGVGTRTADYLNSKDYKTWGERAKAFFLPDVYGGDSNYRAEIFGKGAAYADELAWIQMFDACKREQAEKLGKPMDSEEVLEAAGKRFTEVVRRTQVYDSTLTRSEYMRSKDTGMKMATAFMAEPTTVVSMMLDGLIRANRGDKAFLKKTAGAIAASVIFNALAVSLIYAARDDDEEKTYTEKYLATLATETAEGFNPLEYLPYTRDIMSLMKGYDIERTDMALFADLFKSFERITSSTRTPVEKTTEVAGAVASFFGVPIRNLVRDAMIPVNLVQSAASGERTTGKGISAAIADEFSIITNLFGADTTNAHELYKAAKSGDDAHYNRVKSRYKSEQAAEMALRTALRENDKRIAEAAEAKISGELEAYESIVEQIESEGRFDRNLIIRAINNEVQDIKDNADQVVIPEEEVTDEEDETAEPLYNTSDLNNALTRGDQEDFEDIYYYLLATKQEQGKTEAQAKAAVKSGITSYWKKQYLAAWEENNTTEMKRILELLEETELYGEYNDVATMAQKWIQQS